MPYIDFDYSDINQEALQKAKNAIKEITGKTKPNTDEHWELFYDVYKREGGKVVIIEEKGESTTAMLLKCGGKGPRPLPSIPKPEPIIVIEPKPEPVKPRVIPPLKLKIVELTFLTDHRLLKNNTADWENTGELYEKPDWTPEKSNPISHTMKIKARVRVVIEAEGEAPDDGEIQAKLAGKVFFQSGAVRFNVGRNEFELTSESNLASKIGHGTPTISWFGSTTRSPDLAPIGDTSNKIFMTYGTPISRPLEPDDGVTYYRMNKSIIAITATAKTELHDIVAKLMSYFPTYTLTPNRAVPERYGHPFYTDPKCGAWALGSYVEHTAECQAICRFVRGMMEQVGVPGLEPTVVWAEPTPNDLSFVAKEERYGFGGLTRFTKTVDTGRTRPKIEKYEEPEKLGFFDSMSGKKPAMLTKTRTVTVPITETWYARLTTSRPTVGIDATPCGLNTFEACLKFTDDKAVVKYYGGGAGVYNTKEEVAAAFNSLIWVLTVVPDDLNLPTQYVCKKIVHRWR